MPTAYHMVNYRRFDAGDANLDGQSLESLCRSALNATNTDKVTLWQRPDDRIYDIGGSDGRKIFLNKVADLSSAVFGEMCLAQSRDLQALLNMKPSKVQLSDLTTAVVYDLDEREAPSGSQFIRGLAYWMAIEDHIFFVKTHSMTADLIHQYLDWLLKRQSAIPAALSFHLQAEFDRSQLSGDIGEIRSLRVSGKATPQLSVSLPPEEANPGRVQTARRIADKLVQMHQALPIVQALLGEHKAESLVNSLGPEEYLAVEATVKVRGSRTKESKEKFKNIANDIADMSDAKVQIEGKDGKLTEGDAILRTRMPFNLPYDGSNLLEFDNVADQLQEVYNRFVKDGKIKA